MQTFNTLIIGYDDSATSILKEFAHPEQLYNPLAQLVEKDFRYEFKSLIIDNSIRYESKNEIKADLVFLVGAHDHPTAINARRFAKHLKPALLIHLTGSSELPEFTNAEFNITKNESVIDLPGNTYIPGSIDVIKDICSTLGNTSLIGFDLADMIACIGGRRCKLLCSMDIGINAFESTLKKHSTLLEKAESAFLILGYSPDRFENVTMEETLEFLSNLQNSVSDNCAFCVAVPVNRKKVGQSRIFLAVS